MSRVRRTPRIALALVLVLASACADLTFRDSGTLAIAFPPDGSRVALPLRVSWDAASVADGQSYAVFVDRLPQRPGATIDEAFEADDRGGIHVTDATEILLEQLPIRGGVPERDRDRHEITVVILDRDGVRITEAAAFVEVRVERGAP